MRPCLSLSSSCQCTMELVFGFAMSWGYRAGFFAINVSNSLFENCSNLYNVGICTCRSKHSMCICLGCFFISSIFRQMTKTKVACAITRQVLDRVNFAGLKGSALIVNATEGCVKETLDILPDIKMIVGVNSNVETLQRIQLGVAADRSFLPRILFNYKEPDERHNLVETLKSYWEMTENVLVIVENSSPENAGLLLKARQHLLDTEKDCRILAPCTHHKSCPALSKKSPICIFENPALKANVSRSERLNREPSTGYSYLIVQRKPPLPAIALSDTHPATLPGRLINSSIKRSGHVIMDACMPSGLIERHIVSKRHGTSVYKEARKSQWGDLFDIPVSSGDGPKITRVRQKSQEMSEE
ncbi:mitochondrial small ribosomal subunit Rsm22-domain-containing protein [Obelidium mucronatum]|nr:mitochondrial small ribosomal subunit Rsm22-domain-containing protein [Obelidium mucronatum]